MTMKEILYGSGGALVLIMSFLQVSKININPWTAIFGWIGRQLNHEMFATVAGLEKRMETMQNDIDTIRDEGRERHAKDCRVRILRFADEIYLGTNHSQENQFIFPVLHDLNIQRIYFRLRYSRLGFIVQSLTLHRAVKIQ